MLLRRLVAFVGATLVSLALVLLGALVLAYLLEELTGSHDAMVTLIVVAYVCVPGIPVCLLIGVRAAVNAGRPRDAARPGARRRLVAVGAAFILAWVVAGLLQPVAVRGFGVLGNVFALAAAAVTGVYVDRRLARRIAAMPVTAPAIIAPAIIAPAARAARALPAPAAIAPAPVSPRENVLLSIVGAVVVGAVTMAVVSPLAAYLLRPASSGRPLVAPWVQHASVVGVSVVCALWFAVRSHAVRRGWGAAPDPARISAS